MKRPATLVATIAAVVALAGVAMADEVVWRTLAIRGVADASIEVPDFMKEVVAAEKSAKGAQVKTLFVAIGIDQMGGQLFCALSRQFYAHDKRNLTAVQSQELTASQLTNDPGIACGISRVPDGKYEQNARIAGGFAAASCVTIYIDPDNKNKDTRVIESNTMIAAPRYFYRFVCTDDVARDVRVEVGEKFVWDQELKGQVTHMVDSLKLPTR